MPGWNTEEGDLALRAALADSCLVSSQSGRSGSVPAPIRKASSDDYEAAARLNRQVQKQARRGVTHAVPFRIAGHTHGGCLRGMSTPRRR